MGVIQLALGAESERGDIFDFEAGTSDSDIEEEERRHEFVAMPRALQRVEAAPGFLKRTYGVLEYDSTFMERRRRKCAKLGQQLDGLRAVVPYSTRVSTWSLNHVLQIVTGTVTMRNATIFC